MPYNSYNVRSEILILDQSWEQRVNGGNDRVVQPKPQSTLQSMEESPRKSTLFTVSTR